MECNCSDLTSTRFRSRSHDSVTGSDRFCCGHRTGFYRYRTCTWHLFVSGPMNNAIFAITFCTSRNLVCSKQGDGLSIATSDGVYLLRVMTLELRNNTKTTSTTTPTAISHLGCEESIPLWGQVVDDSVLRPVQREATHQQNDQHDVWKGCCEVHNLQIQSEKNSRNV